MSAPFLKKDKSGVEVRFSKALYQAKALPQLQGMFPGQISISKESKQYFTIHFKGGSEDDGLRVCERLLGLSRQTGKTS